MQHLQHFSIALHSRSVAVLLRIELNMYSDHYSFGVYQNDDHNVPFYANEFRETILST